MTKRRGNRVGFIVLSLGLMTGGRARADDECDPGSSECVRVQERCGWPCLLPGSVLFALGYVPMVVAATDARHEAAAIPIVGPFIDAAKREREQASDPSASTGKYWFAYGALGVVQLVGLGVAFAGAVASETRWGHVPKRAKSMHPVLTAGFTSDSAHIGLHASF